MSALSPGLTAGFHHEGRGEEKTFTAHSSQEAKHEVLPLPHAGEADGEAGG
jgi:hypothetical protein